MRSLKLRKIEFGFLKSSSDSSEKGRRRMNDCGRKLTKKSGSRGRSKLRKQGDGRS